MLGPSAQKQPEITQSPNSIRELAATSGAAVNLPHAHHGLTMGPPSMHRVCKKRGDTQAHGALGRVRISHEMSDRRLRPYIQKSVAAVPQPPPFCGPKGVIRFAHLYRHTHSHDRKTAL